MSFQKTVLIWFLNSRISVEAKKPSAGILAPPPKNRCGYALPAASAATQGCALVRPSGSTLTPECACGALCARSARLRGFALL